MDKQVPRFNPYQGLDQRSYWKSGVAEQHGFSLPDIYRKKFLISAEDRIATAGSCFAQHIARYMRASGYVVLDVEPPPPGLSDEVAASFGYGIYSARYGNIYTPRQLLQLMKECQGEFAPREAVWLKDGRYFDALRPSVEPSGLSSETEVGLHRENHLSHFRSLMEQASVFIFTLGLTETFEHIPSGTVYPTAPGTIAGSFDPLKFRFKNLSFSDVKTDFLDFRARARSISPDLRFILTVSPVPLTATASTEHVLSATIFSKSVLRAVAGELSQEFNDVDYFPSYEIITGHWSRGLFFEKNLRSVTDAGVDVVMKSFFAEHPRLEISTSEKKAKTGEVVCEEALLEAFAK